MPDRLFNAEVRIHSVMPMGANDDDNPENFCDLLDRINPDTKIIRLLMEFNWEARKDGGLSASQMRALTKGEGELGAKAITEKCDRMISAGIVVPSAGDEGEKRYRLSDDAAIALSGLNTRSSNLEGTCIPFGEKSLKERAERYNCHYVVKVPGSTLVAGDHAVLLGEPAVVLPIPLSLWAGLTIHTSSEWSDDIEVNPLFGQADANDQFDRLRSPLPTLLRNIPSRVADANFHEFSKRVLDKFREKLKERWKGDPIRSITVKIASDIPTQVGLGSSGAVSAALALLLETAISKTSPHPEEWSSKSEKDLNASSSRFLPVFRDACDFERIIHRYSSGVGPFASLVGTPDGTPILYARNLPTQVPPRAEEESSIHIATYKKLNSDAVKRMRKEFAIANIYTQFPRPRISDTLGVEEHWKKLIKGKSEMSSVTRKVWENLEDKDWSDVVAGLNLYASYEIGYLDIMGSPEEEIVRRLCGRFYGLGLGTKYTGAGKGGDLLVAGKKKQVDWGLIPNYFPVHYASFAVRLSEETELGSVPRTFLREPRT